MPTYILLSTLSPHGVGTLKRDFVDRELDPLQLAVQRQVRSTLDPEGLFNPGKAF